MFKKFKNNKRITFTFVLLAILLIILMSTFIYINLKFEINFSEAFVRIERIFIGKKIQQSVLSKQGTPDAGVIVLYYFR